MGLGASSTAAVEVGAVEPARVRLVVLAAGSSTRMGRDKLVAPFAGVPLARRVVTGLLALRPLVVTPPEVAAVLGELEGVELVVTERTAGPSVTLGLANAAIPADLALAVVACDLPFLDANAVEAFVARVPDDADLAYPVVGGTPGHPVIWSPKARTLIAALGAAEAPARIRRNPNLRVVEIASVDDAYTMDVDTPGDWDAAERRAVRPNH